MTPDLFSWWLQLRLFEQWLHVIGALCVVYVVCAWWADCRKWRRLVRVCGSEAAAVRVLTAAEAIPAEVRSETLMAMGMEGAKRRGWLS